MTPTQSPTLASQATAELPKLPECFKHSQVYGIGWILYTADQMNAHYLAGVEAGKASRAQSEPEGWREALQHCIEVIEACQEDSPRRQFPLTLAEAREALAAPATLGETK